MLGPEGVANLVVARLRADVPPKLAELRTRLGVTAAELPDVRPEHVRWAEQDTASIEQFPMLVVTVLGTGIDQGPVSFHGSGTSNAYSYRYLLSIFAWSRGRDRAHTQRSQWRMALAVREVLLAKRPMTPTIVGPDYLTLDPNELREDYSDVEQNPARQWLAATRIDLQLVSEERLAAPQPTQGQAQPSVLTQPGMPGP